MINIKNLYVDYEDGTKVLNGVTLQIEENTTTAIIGENGAGKSTLFYAVLGIVPIKSGQIEIDKKLLNKKTIKDIQKEVGLVFQNPDNQLFMNSVYEDLTFSLVARGEDKLETEKKASRLIDTFNLKKIINKPSYKISGGEKRKVAIASILISNPKIILFDEPSSFLDPKGKRNLINTLNNINTTKIIASHDLDLVKKTSENIIILKEGKVFKTGKTNDILNNEQILIEGNL